MAATATARRTRAKRTAPPSQPPLRVMPSAKRTREAEATALMARFSICRAEGHEWRHLGRGDNLNAAPRFHSCIPFVSNCQNCGTTRTKWFNSRGRSEGLEYRYPDNYAQRGDDKLDRDDWGKLFIRSVLGEVA